MRVVPSVSRCVWMGWALALTGCQWWGRQAPTEPVAPSTRPAEPVCTQPTRHPRTATRQPGATSRPTADVVARVNGEPITRQELIRALFQRHGRDALEGMIIHRLVRQAALQAGVQITDKEVTSFVQATAQRMGLSPKKLAQVMRTNRQDWYRRVWQKMAVERIVKRQVTVSDKDLRMAFDGKYGETLKARWIVTRNLRDAQKVWEELHEKPQDFGRLARQHSVDPATRSIDGELQQRVRRNMFSEDAEKALFRLREGETSAVLQTRFGYAIFKCEKRFPAKKVTLAGVREKLREEVREAKTKEAVKSFMADLVNSAALQTPLYPDLVKERLRPSPADAATGTRR